jgi:hypothetical protein
MSNSETRPRNSETRPRKKRAAAADSVDSAQEATKSDHDRDHEGMTILRLQGELDVAQRKLQEAIKERNNCRTLLSELQQSCLRDHTPRSEDRMMNARLEAFARTIIKLNSDCREKAAELERLRKINEGVGFDTAEEKAAYMRDFTSKIDAFLSLGFHGNDDDAVAALLKL